MCLQGIFSRTFLACIACLALFSKVSAQPKNIYGQAVDAVTLKALPFPIISVEGDSLEYLGDMEGNFSVPVGKGPDKFIRVRAYQYLYADMKVRPGDTVRAQMYYAHPFTWQNLSLAPARKLIASVLKKRRSIDPAREKNYRYKTYNKSLITTENMPALKVYLDNFLRFFTSARMGQYALDHHIFLMESATEMEFVSKRKQKEMVKATQASGISKPPPLSFVSGFDALSIFEPFLRIGPKKYISPLAGRAMKRYAFSITDSIMGAGGKVYVVRFNPLSYRKKDLLQGILYISESGPGVIAFQAWPSFDRESTFSLAQQARQLPSGRWFPEITRTAYLSEGLGSLRIPVMAVSKTWIRDFTPLESSAGRFNEVVFDFQQKNLVSDSAFPESMRSVPLRSKDINTYRYYQQVGSLTGIDHFLNFGQKLVDGRFPAGKLDLVFKDAIRLNDFEGIRLGLGLESNDRFSTRYRFGGWAAYGIRDEAWKYGLSASYQCDDKNSLSLSWKKDLAEPGLFPLAFERRQYPAEDLRKFRVSRFDAIQAMEFNWHFRPFRNFNVQASLEAGSRDFLYDYRYLPRADVSGIGFSEAKVQLCWSPLEHFARLDNQFYSISSDLPVLWLHYARGFSGLMPVSFSYNRLESRIQWNRKILGLGDFGIRLSAGMQDDFLPYPLLFSGRGSYREFSLLSYNSFETMRYNEFCFNKFFHVFLSHRFGKMQISTLPFLPYFTLVHNMGWGSLAKPELHQGIRAMDIRKGFFESGLFLNDLFVIPLSGLDLGIGAGLFLRYGPYSLPSDFDNLALKFSASLGI